MGLPLLGRVRVRVSVRVRVRERVSGRVGVSHGVSATLAPAAAAGGELGRRAAAALAPLPLRVLTLLGRLPDGGLTGVERADEGEQLLGLEVDLVRDRVRVRARVGVGVGVGVRVRVGVTVTVRLRVDLLALRLLQRRWVCCWGLLAEAVRLGIAQRHEQLVVLG